MVNEVPEVLNGEAEGPMKGLSSRDTVDLTWICGVCLKPQMSVYRESITV